MRTNTLEIFEAFKRTMSESDAKMVVQYLEDANEEMIEKTINMKIEHLATKQDTFELKEDLANTKADIIKWMFLFWVAQLGAMFGFLHFFLK